jgi:hypothetical protein
MLRPSGCRIDARDARDAPSVDDTIRRCRSFGRALTPADRDAIAGRSRQGELGWLVMVEDFSPSARHQDGR